MVITNENDFMKMIAKHYEKCRGIYLHTLYDIPFRLTDGSTARLEGLPEDAEEKQSVAIMHAILAAPVFETGKQEVTIVEDVLAVAYEKFKIMMSIEKFIDLGYMEWDKDKTDEDGFPGIKIVVPPDKWDVPWNKEA